MKRRIDAHSTQLLAPTNAAKHVCKQCKRPRDDDPSSIDTTFDRVEQHLHIDLLEDEPDDSDTESQGQQEFDDFLYSSHVVPLVFRNFLAEGVISCHHLIDIIDGKCTIELTVLDHRHSVVLRVGLKAQAVFHIIGPNISLIS